MSKIVDRIFNTVLTADDSSAQEELGSFRFEDGKIYKYVYFEDSTATAAAIGSPLIYDGTYNYKVTTDLDSGAGVGAVAGVAITTNSTASYGWIQIYGAATVKVTDLITAGDHLIASGTDNFWTVSVVDITDATGTAALDITITGHKAGAVALETTGTAADGTITAFIRCM